MIKNIIKTCDIEGCNNVVRGLENQIKFVVSKDHSVHVNICNDCCEYFYSIGRIPTLKDFVVRR
jgi:hypothetical protein